MKSVGHFKMREGTLSMGSWGLSSSPLCPKCLAQELLGTRVSGAETQLHSIYQPVCPEEGVPAPGGSPPRDGFSNSHESLLHRRGGSGLASTC